MKPKIHSTKVNAIYIVVSVNKQQQQQQPLLT